MTEEWEVANPWRAGCGESRTSGSEGGVGRHCSAVRPAPTLPESPKSSTCTGRMNPITKQVEVRCR
jgi:hypothetical protein